MSTPSILCRKDPRRKEVRAAPRRYGLDYVEVSADQRTLHVTFLGKAPSGLHNGNFRIEGGERIRDIQVTHVTSYPTGPESEKDDSADLRVDKAGDFSCYTLRVVAADEHGHPTDLSMAGFDPRYDRVDFRFKAACPSDLDCKPKVICPPPARTEPEINYLAKDYASFRQLILDRLALLMPDWRERHAADIGIALVEILAYVGDHLSYFQDAVATEAYLETARKRISVRRHVRLVDYRLSEGCNARAWLCLQTKTDLPPISPDDIYFTTGFKTAPEDRWVLNESDLEGVPSGSYRVFEPLVPDPAQPLQFRAAHSEIKFYTWDYRECCLPQGATSAVLIDEWVEAPTPAVAATDSERPTPPPATASDGRARKLCLREGDVLIIREILGPRTGVPNDADPTHRHAVRLTKVAESVDDLHDPPQPILLVEWDSRDALPFPVCISSVTQAPDCRYLENVSVACGNVILVDHGKTTGPESLGCVPVGSKRSECECECRPAETTLYPGEFSPSLSQAPLTFAEPLPASSPASRLLMQDPRRALPAICLTGSRQSPSGPIVTKWRPRHDLLESGSEDPDYVVEMDDLEVAHLRFGDGDCGRQPDAATEFTAQYRVGNGPDGNVGRETIRYIVFRKNPVLADLSVCNPLAAQGGTLPEPLAQIKLLAPYAFRDRLERAITADDYAALAERNQDLQQAAAALRWTGSWYEALVAIDPKGTEEPQTRLERATRRHLYRYRKLGHDVAVAPARYVALDIEMIVCVLPDFLRGHIEAELLDVFSNRVLPDGRLGFFHPDKLTFRQGIYLGQLIATAQRVRGVESVNVTRFERLYEGPNGEIENGVLPLEAFEIARLDNDPSFPEKGRITFDVRGGR